MCQNNWQSCHINKPDFQSNMRVYEQREFMPVVVVARCYSSTQHSYLIDTQTAVMFTVCCLIQSLGPVFTDFLYKSILLRCID